jgi:hypothetical protein
MKIGIPWKRKLFTDDGHEALLSCRHELVLMFMVSNNR